ncbi:hypothetical protein Fcan01_18824 [Folsomia candida]|uniref:Uncharacterized protein n=1 Tax=Folsomia candida TaxID=158441 RepID=A0A226DNG8_FOLCA|nr:hypothetical protein Fcan01_18824 [Folsomia candida]
MAPKTNKGNKKKVAKPVIKCVSQAELKLKAKSKKTTRVGATVNIKRRASDYRRQGDLTKSHVMYHAKSSNIKKAENLLLSGCKKRKVCKKNKQAKSNVSQKSGDTYVIQRK